MFTACNKLPIYLACITCNDINFSSDYLYWGLAQHNITCILKCILFILEVKAVRFSVKTIYNIVHYM